ncbi:MAG TPA: polysaccharide biosynthesis/export family protein [Verrucomicrobiae bacterium]|nr:polysaccharide biosynthesis/export family protein [Verrucomicrobiae bacterium]
MKMRPNIAATLRVLLICVLVKCCCSTVLGQTGTNVSGRICAQTCSNATTLVRGSPGIVTNAHPEIPPEPVPPGSYVPDDKYKLRLGDRVSFQILQDRDAPRLLTVADSGELELPYLGRVAASGKTCKQLTDELKTLLEKEYYYTATLIISLDAANKILGRVYVWGQVKTQGALDVVMDENLTAGKALLRAGGFADFANKKKVKVIRPGAAGAPRQVFELNMIEILEDGEIEKDMPLRAEDSVIVSSRLINF